jgi:steroid 5-alpha reductase family enzyme
MAIKVLDNNYLAITFLISLAIQSLAFLVSYTLQFDKITDFSGGSNFFILALITLVYGQTFLSRNWIASLAVMLWAIRLAGFLLFRCAYLHKGLHRFFGIRSSFKRTYLIAVFFLLKGPKTREG